MCVFFLNYYYCFTSLYLSDSYVKNACFFPAAEGEEEESCCGHRRQSSDLQLREILRLVSAEGDVKHSHEEKGEWL